MFFLGNPAKHNQATNLKSDQSQDGGCAKGSTSEVLVGGGQKFGEHQKEHAASAKPKRKRLQACIRAD
jgi:hypothetical protein